MRSSSPARGRRLRTPWLLVALVVVLARAATAGPLPGPQEPSPDPPAPATPSAADPAARWAFLNDPQRQLREPFRIFDNLYYVGIGWVSCYLLTTPEGHVLIDSLYGDFVDHALDAVKKLGFDPGDIRYVLVTHGHFDHVGGAKVIHERTGARIAMTEQDWRMTQEAPASGPTAYPAPARDLVLGDGDTLSLGGTEIELYVTPGHTRGVLSLAFPVRDGEATYRAFTFGGVGLNFQGEERTRMYLASVDRIRGMEGIEVNVPNHASMGRVFERARELDKRKPGDPHPFVDAEGFASWLVELEENAQKKLRDEMAAGRP